MKATQQARGSRAGYPRRRHDSAAPSPMLTADSVRAPLQTLVTVMRRQWRLMLLCVVLVPATSLAFSLTQDERYTGSALLLFRDPALDDKLFGSSFFPVAEDPARQAATNVRLVSLTAVAERTAAALNRQGLSAGQISQSVSVSQEGESDVVEIEAEAGDPQLAADIANTFATEYIGFRTEADRARIREAQALLDAQIAELSPTEQAGPEGQRLREGSQELEVLSSLQTGNAELVQEASAPASPSSPKTRRNVVLGLLVGIMLGAALAFLRDQLDRRLRDADEAQEIYGRPILATIPKAASMSGRNAIRLHQPHDAANEAFRMLRTNLRYFNVDRRVDSVLVTSATPQDGKTTVSWNLALSEAEGGKRVLLIEADLRRPTISASMEATKPEGGLSLVLSDEQAFEDALIEVEAEAAGGTSTGGHMDVLVAGPLPPNPTELLESERMQLLLRDARRSYDLVVVDTPPAGQVADAIPLMARVSGVVVVVRLDQTERPAAANLHDELTQLDAPVLGIVVNGAAATDSYYYRQPTRRR